MISARVIYQMMVGTGEQDYDRSHCLCPCWVGVVRHILECVAVDPSATCCITSHHQLVDRAIFVHSNRPRKVFMLAWKWNFRAWWQLLIKMKIAVRIGHLWLAHITTLWRFPPLFYNITTTSTTSHFGHKNPNLFLFPIGVGLCSQHINAHQSNSLCLFGKFFYINLAVPLIDWCYLWQQHTLHATGIRYWLNSMQMNVSDSYGSRWFEPIIDAASVRCYDRPFKEMAAIFFPVQISSGNKWRMAVGARQLGYITLLHTKPSSSIVDYS